jgi:hypothetical protein
VIAMREFINDVAAPLAVGAAFAVVLLGAWAGSFLAHPLAAWGLP